MTKKKLPVRFTGQHFTIDKVLIKDAIKLARKPAIIGYHMLVAFIISLYSFALTHFLLH